MHEPCGGVVGLGFLCGLWCVCLSEERCAILDDASTTMDGAVCSLFLVAGRRGSTHVPWFYGDDCCHEVAISVVVMWGVGMAVCGIDFYLMDGTCQCLILGG